MDLLTDKSLVDLNHDLPCVASQAKKGRAAEEAQGKVRWLRPEYQDPGYQKTEDRGQNKPNSPARKPLRSQVSNLSPLNWFIFL